MLGLVTIQAGTRKAGEEQEDAVPDLPLSQGLPKAPRRSPASAHTPAVQGPRVRAGKQLRQCPGLTWGHMRASPAGVSPGVGAATRSGDAGKAVRVGAESWRRSRAGIA